MVTAMWSMSNRTGTSDSKCAVISTLAAGAVLKVIRPVVTFTDQPESCSTPSLWTRTEPATGFETVRISMTLPEG
jgi:hypothetical protein